MTYRKSEHPATLFSIASAAILVAAAAGFGQGMRVGVQMRECPATLPDGRVLASLNIKTGQCNYSRVPVQYDATERGRVTRAQARMGAVR